MPIYASTIMAQQAAEQQNILSLAQQGNPTAIATLINEVLSKKGITATASLEGTLLIITLISEQVFSPEGCVKFLQHGMSQLGAISIKSVQVIGKQPHHNEPVWIQKFELATEITSSFVTPPAVPLKPPPQKLKTKLFWLSLGIIFSILFAELAIVVKHQLANQQVANKKAAPIQQKVAKNNQKLAPKNRHTPANKKPQTASPKSKNPMQLEKIISGRISPKSVVYSGQGLFFAQNMMYNHTITVYNREHKLVKIIPDTVNLAKFGYVNFKGNYKGAPVEAGFSDDGKYAWISNYQMYGKGFNNPGNDKCNAAQKYDQSFLYRINTKTLQIEKVIKVGAVPKFVATTPNNRLVLVSNWCSWDLSLVDTNKNQEIKRIKIGPYPRGIVVDAASQKAYVAVMGSYDIAQVDLKNYAIKWLKNIGHSPRHLNLEPTGKYLYASLNGEGTVAKIDVLKGKVISKSYTGNAPRSMVLSKDGQLLYVVNYNENTVSKVRTKDMKVMQKVSVGANPIGITYDPQTREIWVACYSGQIIVFQD